MQKQTRWLNWEQKTKNPIVLAFTSLSLFIRRAQFEYFLRILKPTSKMSILDVGVTSDMTFKDSNLFEILYPWKEKITAATVEDTQKIKKYFNKIKVKKTHPGEKLPFKAKQFDIAVSWATLEHVGSREDQQYFVNELLRVGKKVFITTPDRQAIYEPHTGYFMLHWLPLNWFRIIVGHTDRKFWSKEENLNPLGLNNLQEMKFVRKVKFRKFKLFKLMPSHIIITA